MTTWPTIKVQIAFASDAFDTTPTWTDVSSDVMDISIRRGRTYEMNRIEAGTATVRLKNIDGDYWPNNTTSAYYGNIKPVKRINIQACYPTATTAYDLYTGYIEAWTPAWIQEPITAPVMDLSCADLLKNISRYMINNTTGYAAELSGTRVANVLSEMSWPTSASSIATGQSTMISTGALANVNAMDHLYNVLDSELGILFISASGSAVFQDRATRNAAPYDTSQAIFSDGTGTTDRYVTPNIAYDDLYIYNDCRGTRTGGTEMVATDSDSILANGQRTLEASDLLNSSDDDVVDRVYYQLSRYKDAQLRVESLTIKPSSSPTSLFPKVFSYDISTRITVALSQASINEDYYIEGIEHDWSASAPENWVTKWQLSNASDVAYPIRAYLDLIPDSDVTIGISNIYPTTPATHYDKASATTGAYIFQDGSVALFASDTYELSTPSTTIAKAVKVAVYGTAKKQAGAASGILQMYLISGTTTYSGTAHTLTTAYVESSDSFNVNLTEAQVLAHVFRHKLIDSGLLGRLIKPSIDPVCPAHL